jgi:hypothetical protein
LSILSFDLLIIIFSHNLYFDTLFFFVAPIFPERAAARTHAAAEETPHRPEDLHPFLPGFILIYFGFPQCEVKFPYPHGIIAALASSQEPGHRPFMRSYRVSTFAGGNIY